MAKKTEPKVSSHQEALNIAGALETKLKSNLDLIKKQGKFQSWLNGELQETEQIYKVINKDGVVRNKISKKDLENVTEQLGLSNDLGDAISQLAPGMTSAAVGAEQTVMAFKNMIPGVGAAIGVVYLLGKAFLEVQKQVTDTRKELGVTYSQAVSITAQNKVLAQVAKGYGLDIEDIKSAQTAIRKDLGASVQESVNLSVNFARTAAATGQTAEDLSGTLSIMESISSASRDVLLNQIRTNAAIIGAAGVSPALVMKDIAENAGFFAQFAKDGGSNIIGAGIAARKLGLEMSTVAGMAESLLDFESSIEAQLEASMLLGRQINFDKARQLAFTGDIEGMQREILKQVGGEAEFAEMNYLARKKLAAAAGTNVENLARLVRNNTAGGTAGAVGAAVAGGTNVYSDPTSHEYLRKLVRNTE